MRGSQPPLLKHTLLNPACSLFLNFLFPLVSFCSTLLRYFRQLPHLYATPSSPNST